MYVLRYSQGFLYISADLRKTRLKLLVAIVFFAATSIVTSVVLIAALGHGGNSNVKLNSKKRGSTSIGRCWLIAISGKRLISVAALVLAEPVLPSEEVEGGVKVGVDAVDAVADGLEGHPPVGGLRGLLGPQGLRLRPHPRQ